MLVGGILNTTSDVHLYNIYVTSDSELNLCYDNTTNKGATLVGSNTTIENGALKYKNTIISGEINNGLITSLYCDSAFNFGVKDGFTISGLTLTNGAEIRFEGGNNTFVDCSINSNCSVFIGDKDIANNITVNTGASVYVSQGIVNNMTVSNGAEVMLYALNGNINDITLLDGAKLDMTFEDLPEYDPFEYSFIAGQNTNIASGTLYHKGFSVSGSCVNGVWTGLDGIYKLGIGSNIIIENPIINDTGRIYIKDGAIISGGQVLGNANLSLFDSGICYNVSVGIINAITTAYLNVFSGGIANSTTVYQSGRLRLNSGGIASDVVVSSLGGVLLLPTGKLFNAEVSSGGSITISNNAIGENITVSAFGQLKVVSGGVVSKLTTIGTSAYASIFNGLATSNIVNGRICICS